MKVEVGTFCMPSHETFKMKPLRELLFEEIGPGWERHNEEVGLDPFARRRHGFATIYNDLNPECEVDYHLGALEFLKLWNDESVDWVLYDPPYSLRQLKECYDGIGHAMSQHESQKFFSDIKREIVRVLKSGGTVITCGWNSGGVGHKAQFTRSRYLSLYHGGIHNQTIVTVDRKN